MVAAEVAPIARVRDLKKSFGSHRVLNGVSLDLIPGEKLVLIGPSGCGKSTLLRCLNGLERPDSGTINIDGIELDSTCTRLNQVRSEVGMVFQRFNLFPHLTAVQNVMLAPAKVRGIGRAEAKARAETLLHKVGLGDKFNAYPHQLSGGQQQRVAIARALAMTPKILLCDEVTSALDPELVGEVTAVLRQLAHEGMTMVIVTHSMGFAVEVGTRMLFLCEGGIVEENTPTGMLAAPSHPRAKAFLASIKLA